MHRFGPAGDRAPQAGRHVGQVDEPHELERQGFQGQTADMAICGLEVFADILERFAQQRPQIGLRLLFDPLEEGCDDIDRQLVGRGDAKGLCAAPGRLRAASEVDVPRVSQRIQDLLRQVLSLKVTP